MTSPVTTAAAPTAMDDDAATSTTSTTVDAPTTTRRRTALCHNCLSPAPYPLPIPCSRGHCHGTVRYCSDVCRDDDGSVNVGGKHGPISCRFLGQLSSSSSSPGRRNGSGNGEEDGDGRERRGRRRGTRVLIGLDDEPFPTYRRIRCRRRDDDCNGGGDGDSDGDAEEEKEEYEPTGNYVTLRAGESVFEVVKMPHEIDGGGGLLLRRLPSSSSISAASHTSTKFSSKQHEHDDDDDTLYILSDVEALEFPVPPRLDKCNRAAFRDATMPLWHEGVELWHRRKDFLSAMDRFDDALRSIRWGDDDGGEGAVREFAETTTSRTTSSSSSSSSPLLATVDDLERCAAALHGPPVACPRTRLDLSRMAHFYGMCCNDAGRTNEGRMWFGRALRTVPLPSMIGCDGGGGGEGGRSAAILSEGEEENDSSLRTNGRRRDWIQSCFAEFMLSYEEVGMVESARAVARWSIERGVGGSGGGDGWWTNEFQRPGFMYPMMPSAAEEEEVVRGTRVGACASSSSRPYYPRHGGFFPDWCRALEENYDMILGEFFDLVERGGHGGGNNNKDNNNKKSSNGGRAAGEKDDGDPDTTEASLSPKMTPTPLRQPLHWPAVGSGEHRPSGRTDDRVVSDGGDWRETVLFGPGCHHPPSSDVAPKTRALLRRWAHDDVIDLAEDGGGEVIFSVLGPNTKIEPHCAIANVRLTAHLGLVVPSSSSSPASLGAATAAHPKVSRAQPRCAIRVAAEWHQWERGKVILFDDSYEHEVVNDTNACRAVLLVRFWHPAVPVEERRRVLDEVRRRREDDERIRFNPPLPTGLGYEEGRF